MARSAFDRLEAALEDGKAREARLYMDLWEMGSRVYGSNPEYNPESFVLPLEVGEASGSGVGVVEASEPSS
jgi:hypothetical protein